MTISCHSRRISFRVDYVEVVQVGDEGCASEWSAVDVFAGVCYGDDVAAIGRHSSFRHIIIWWFSGGSRETSWQRARSVFADYCALLWAVQLVERFRGVQIWLSFGILQKYGRNCDDAMMMVITYKTTASKKRLEDISRTICINLP